MNFVYPTLIGMFRASCRRSDSGIQAVRPTRACAASKRALQTLAVLALGLAAEARAVPIVHCVGTVQELRNAVAVSNNSEAAFDIRIRSGYYAFTADGTHTHALRFQRESHDYVDEAYRNFRVSGAWNTGCTQQAEVITAQNSTVLDGQDVIGVFSFTGKTHWLPRTQVSTVRVDRLQIARGRSPYMDPLAATSGCFDYRRNVANNPETGARFAFEFDRVRFELCEHAGLVVQAHWGALVRNSFFLGNSGARASAMNIQSDDGLARIYNNTLRNNVLTGNQHSATVVLLGSPQKYFINNLIAENVHPPGAVMTDVLTNGTAVVRSNRLFSVVGDLGSNPIVFGNTTADPGFANLWNARLGPNSPMRDAGFTGAPFPGVGTRDFDGNTRVQGAAVDIGAHELPPASAPPSQDAVFRNGFE
ncbi:MAG TPA: choice-of-anchor Q domain-containing protein [Xanthomonadaceae bacterium]|nr:choice-of-anchor Q domain-containing protein [Xanthomonadaceae bacterium]